MSVEKDQLYPACNPLDEGRTLRIVGVVGGHARIFTVGGPARERWIAVKHLHATATTRDGQPRRSGYALVEE